LPPPARRGSSSTPFDPWLTPFSKKGDVTEVPVVFREEPNNEKTP
jgi:hypothetical protein